MIFRKEILSPVYFSPAPRDKRIIAQAFYDDPDGVSGGLYTSTLHIEMLQDVYILPKVLELSSMSAQDFLETVALEDNSVLHTRDFAKWSVKTFTLMSYYRTFHNDERYADSIGYLLHNVKYDIKNYKLRAMEADFRFMDILRQETSYDIFTQAMYLYFAVVFNYILSGCLLFHVTEEFLQDAGDTTEYNDFNFIFRNATYNVFQEVRSFLYQPTIGIEGCINGTRHPITSYDLSNRF